MLEIVLARAADDNAVGHELRSTQRRRFRSFELSETHGKDLARGHRARGVLLDQQQLLRAGEPGGNYHLAAGFELLQQRAWNEIGGGTHHDLVERRMFGPPVVAVAQFELDVLVALASQSLLRSVCQLFDDLDAVDLARQLGQHGSLIAQAGADLENDVVALDVEQIRHQRHDEWLRDGLVESDRQRHVGVGVGLELDRDEIMARHLAHGLHCGRPKRGFADARAHVDRFRRDLHEHVLAQLDEMFRGHGKWGPRDPTFERMILDSNRSACSVRMRASEHRSMTASLLPSIELETAPNPVASVIWLHGLGADGNDFVPIVPELGIPTSKPVRFIFPHAPVRAVTINNGFRMRAWYDISGADLTNRADLAGVRESQSLVEALVAHERARGVPASRIVLAGFSQGGAIALYTGLRHAERLAGIIALSTYLVAPDKLGAEGSEANRGLSIFMGHGTADPVVRPEWGEASRRALVALGYPVEWHSYGMPHSVCMEEVVAIGAWLRRVL